MDACSCLGVRHRNGSNIRHIDRKQLLLKKQMNSPVFASENGTYVILQRRKKWVRLVLMQKNILRNSQNISSKESTKETARDFTWNSEANWFRISML